MDKFNFGKYIGEKVDIIISTNPSYVKWAKDNVKGFKLSEEQNKQLTLLLSRRL